MKVGNEELKEDIITRGTIGCHGLWKNGSRLDILTFKNKNNSIENCNGEQLSTYSSDWIPVKIQIKYDDYNKKAKITYWINGTNRGHVNIDNVSSSDSYLNTWYDLSCWAGTMMFDNIEIYSFKNLIEKD